MSSGTSIVCRVVCTVSRRRVKSPCFSPFAGRAMAMTRSFGLQSNPISMFWLLSGESQRAISWALPMNGVRSRNCALRHSRLIVREKQL